MRQRSKRSLLIRSISLFQIVLGLSVIGLSIVGDISFSRQIAPQVAKLGGSMEGIGTGVSEFANSAEMVRKSFGGWVLSVQKWTAVIGKLKHILPGSVVMMTDGVNSMAEYSTKMEATISSLRAKGEALALAGQHVGTAPTYAHWHFITTGIIGFAIVANGLVILGLSKGATAEA